MELNKSQDVPNDLLVWMEPAPNQEYFWFSLEGTMLVAKSGSSDIDKRTSSTPASAQVTIQTFNGTSFSDGPQVRAFNWAVTKVKKNAFLNITFSQGYWWITGEECG